MEKVTTNDSGSYIFHTESPVHLLKTWLKFNLLKSLAKIFFECIVEILPEKLKFLDLRYIYCHLSIRC